MRKIISTMMLVAAAAMASVSCQKEDTHSRVENGYISFISTNPETRTEWNGQTVVWSVDDVIRVACQQDGTWYTSGTPSKAKLYVSETLSADALAEGAESVQFKVKTGNNAFPADLTGILQFYALYPSNVADASFDQDTSCESVKIAVEQKVSSSTYDRSCDIMWGKATTTCGAMPTGPVPIVWNRVVAHANISLNKIEGIVTGEKINKITLTAQEDAALAGTFNLNMATGEFSAQSTSNTITLTCDNIIADASGNVEFWACVNPCTLTELDIEVDTDKAVYTIKKTGFSRDFKVNQRNILPINMSTATRTAKEVVGESYVYTFTSNAWADNTNSWISNANGYQKKDQGISVTVAKTGAGATTKSSMANVSKIIVTYCTNASTGAGSIQVSVNNNDTRTLDVTTNGGTAHRTLEFDYSQSKPTGVVSFKVNCTKNSIYIKSIEIIASN